MSKSVISYRAKIAMLQLHVVYAQKVQIFCYFLVLEFIFFTDLLVFHFIVVLSKSL